jgi:hypothetical protein
MANILPISYKYLEKIYMFWEKLVQEYDSRINDTLLLSLRRQMYRAVIHTLMEVH